MRAIWSLCVLLAVVVAGCEQKREGKPESKESRTEKKVYTRDEFRKKVVGKTESEVVKAVGKPDSTTEITGHRAWSYRGITRDPVTEKLDFSAQIIFENGIADRVNF